MSENTEVKSEKELVLIQSKIKDYIKSKGYMTASDALDGLNERVYRLIDEALERTSANKRTTVKPIDF
jgi:hypothetical protein